MAFTTIDDPSEYFQTALWTGTGSSRSVTNDGNSDLQPDWLWVKRRSATNSHHLVNSSIGLSGDVALASDLTNAQFSTPVSAFNSDGFSFNAGDASCNANSSTYVAWQWKANGGTTSSNSDGSITSTVQANTTSGFSIVSYTGNGTSGATVGHGLSSKPGMMIFKERNGATGWVVYQHKNTSAPATEYLQLNSTNATDDYAGYFNDTEPTSSVFTLGNDTGINQNNDTYIAYCFAEKKGFSKFGKFTGNGSTDGTFIHTGFKPAFVLAKPTDITGNWPLFDNKLRPANNVGNNFMYADLSNAQDSSSDFDMLSNGFKTRTTSNLINGSGNSYIYMCFASNPFVTSTGIPTTAR